MPTIVGNKFLLLNMQKDFMREPTESETPPFLRVLTNRGYRRGGTKHKYSQVMRNVEEANHILYGCIVIGSNPALTTKIYIWEILDKA